jgi:EAL domain-containing protein (putative c-di-GMP-specific phosphodiesterase class I)
LDGHEAYITASIGVTLSSGANTRAEDLLRAAEIALYQAKADGRSTFRVFESRMAERMTSRLGLETELRRALDRNELRLFYQPQVDLSTGAIVGAEALVRWEHPRRGLIAPGEFIPTAEQSGLIIPIGVWVLDEACRQTAEWRALGAAGRRLFIGINLAGRQLRHPDFIKSVLQAAMTAGLPLRRLELELTERAVVEDVEGATELFNQLKRHKIRLAIDDFGTGYCSLSSLRRWPVDVIKIDRSFLADIDHDAGSRQLIEAMVRLARALDADVTAEGIESPAQLAWCKSIGVSRGQGFCFAPPLPAAAFEELLKSDHHYPVSPTGALRQANFRR